MNRRQLLLGSAATVAASTIPLPAKLGMSEAASAVAPEVNMMFVSTPCHATSIDLYGVYSRQLAEQIARAYHIPWEQLTAEWPT